MTTQKHVHVHATREERSPSLFVVQQLGTLRVFTHAILTLTSSNRTKSART